MRAFVTVWILAYVLTDVVRHVTQAAREWSNQDPATGGFIPDPAKFIGERVRAEFLRAADLGGRWTIAALLWSLIYFAIRNNVVSSGTARFDLSRLIADYINVALLVGPILGMVWWAAEWEYRQGLERADRTLASETLGVVANPSQVRKFLASAEPLAGVLGAAVVALCVVALSGP